jgi:hypothetical protein
MTQLPADGQPGTARNDIAPAKQMRCLSPGVPIPDVLLTAKMERTI